MLDNVGFVYSMGEGIGGIGANITYTAVSDMVFLDQNGDTALNNYSYSYLGGKIFYSYYIKNLSAGLGINFSNEKIADTSYTNFYPDLGILYSIPVDFSNIHIGLSSKNFIFADDIPFEIKTGLGIELKNIPILIALDLGYNSIYGLTGGTGMSYTLLEMFSMYAGYTFDNYGGILSHLRTGFDFSYQNYSVGYSIRMNEIIGMNHFIELGFEF